MVNEIYEYKDKQGFTITVEAPTKEIADKVIRGIKNIIKPSAV